MYDKKWDVVGVVNDFHQKSLRYAMEPTVLQPFFSPGNWISVKLNTGNVRATMEAVKRKYEAFFPGNPFDYFFLDESYNRQYKNDQLFGKAFALFAGFAILIACLGLLGLALFGTSQRIREIGVRKVLGASVTNIVLLLSKDFVILIGFAFLIAAPVALVDHAPVAAGFRVQDTVKPVDLCGGGRDGHADSADHDQLGRRSGPL
ncbi:ABC transporter permease [Puia sp. P3]|uniref:ABC transporter permease n=1 Tax=Puia sp. P3 TaxID=3423952 RepID=UPI003D67B351